MGALLLSATLVSPEISVLLLRNAPAPTYEHRVVVIDQYGKCRILSSEPPPGGSLRVADNRPWERRVTLWQKRFVPIADGTEEIELHASSCVSARTGCF